MTREDPAALLRMATPKLRQRYEDSSSRNWSPQTKTAVWMELIRRGERELPAPRRQESPGTIRFEKSAGARRWWDGFVGVYLGTAAGGAAGAMFGLAGGLVAALAQGPTGEHGMDLAFNLIGYPFVGLICAAPIGAALGTVVGGILGSIGVYWKMDAIDRKRRGDRTRPRAAAADDGSP